MKKFTLHIAFALVALCALPQVAVGSRMVEIIENEIHQVAISISGESLRVTGANGLMLQVYNVTGVRIQSVHIDSNDKTIPLNLSKGCYIVKVGKVVRKFSVN